MWGRRKTFLDREVEDWHGACWAWLLRNLGGMDDLRQQPNVLPTADFFPAFKGSDRERVEQVFARVQSLMGLADWPCTLVEQDRTNAQLSDFMVLQPTGISAAGTFQAADGEVIITYDPALLQRPLNLITTFAHELAHYLLHTIEEPAPGVDVEPKLEELATELAVAYHGFGVIAANAAFDFQQYQDVGRQGWSGGSWGYFSEDGWVFALAVFLRLRGEDAAPSRAKLKPHLAEKLDKALRRLDDDPAFLAALH